MRSDRYVTLSTAPVARLWSIVVSVAGWARHDDPDGVGSRPDHRRPVGRDGRAGQVVMPIVRCRRDHPC